MKSGGEEERDVWHRGHREEVEELKVESQFKTKSVGSGVGGATLEKRNSKGRTEPRRGDNAAIPRSRRSVR